MATSILSAGEKTAVGGFKNIPSSWFFQGTTSSEEVTIGDGVTATFSLNFRNSNDVIRVAGLAANFTIAYDGATSATLTSITDGITITLPLLLGAGTTIVFESSPGVFDDTRLLKLFPDTNGDTLPDLFLGAQQIEGGPGEVVDAKNGSTGGINLILTTGIDTAPGGAGDDTFLAAGNTLTAGDKLDGGAGVNTLDLSIDSNTTNNNFGGFTTKNVQVVNVTNDDSVGTTAVTLDLSGTVGVTKVVSDNSSHDVTFAQLPNLATIELNNITNPAVGFPNDQPDVIVTFQDSVVAGKNDIVDVNIKTSIADDLQIGRVNDTNGGIEQVNLHVADGTSSLDTLNTDLTTLNIDNLDGKGTAAFKIDDALNNTVKTIDASTLTGSLDIDFTDNDAGGAGVNFKGATGDNIVFGGNAGDTIVTYDGNDFIVADNILGDGFGNESVDAGKGNNTVVTSGGSDTVTAADGANIVITNNGGDTVTLGDGGNYVRTFAYGTTFPGSGLGSFSVADYKASGSDVVNTGKGADTITTGDGDDLIGSGEGDDHIFVGAGQHTIDAGKGNDTIDSTTGDFHSSSNLADILTGGEGTDELRVAQDLVNSDFNTATSIEVLTQTTAGKTIDFSSASSAESAGIRTINFDWGYQGNDTLDASGFSEDLTINVGGGAGDSASITPNDLDGNPLDLTVTGGLDTVAGAADSVGGGTDSLAGGSGNDTFNMPGNGNLDATDLIDGNGGNDTVVLDGDTTIVSGDNAFTQVEAFVLLTNEDPLAANSYAITFEDFNSPDSQPLEVDGTGLASDEGVFISSEFVTGFSISVDGGAGNDTVHSGVLSDTISTGAGSDLVDISFGAQPGGGDFVGLGTGNDTLVAGLNLTSADTVVGGADTDTVAVSGRNYVDADFTQVTEVEILNVAEGFTNTLSTEAQEAGFTTIVSTTGADNTVIDASGFTTGITIDVSAVGGGFNGDTVIAGSGNDTVIAGVGDQNLSLGAGNDVVEVDGTELDFNDTIAGGTDTGNVKFDITKGDTILLDNTGTNQVNAAVDLDNVTGIENYVIKSDGENPFFDPADHTLVFTGGSVLTKTNINIDASNLTDGDDSFTVTLDSGLANDNYGFSIKGSSTDTTVEKLNDGFDNNINFQGGTGDDTLIINGSDLGSTVTMEGGTGTDTIVQDGGVINDDGYTSITGVEILTGRNGSNGGNNGAAINATLGENAADSGLIQIDDTADDGFGGGDDYVELDAAFDTANLQVNLSSGDDTINAGASSTIVSLYASDFNLTKDDVLTGGKGKSDTLFVSGTSSTGDLTSVTGFENVTVLHTGSGTTLILDTATGDVNGGVQTIDATQLDQSSETLTLNAGTASAKLVVNSGWGDDSITTGTGDDTISGGEGNNTIVSGDGADSITSGAGNDSILAGLGNDTINAGNGANFVNGGDGADSITTGSGKDTVVGGVGSDTISTGGGDDLITGGAAQDVIDSGDGNDIIRYVTKTDSFGLDTTRDIIKNFNVGGDDKILIETNLLGAGVTDINFVGNAKNFGDAQLAIAATKGDGIADIVYDQEGHRLVVDLDDNGQLDASDLAITMDGLNGNAFSLVTSDEFILADTTAPQAPVLDLENSDDSGVSNTDNITNDGTTDIFVIFDKLLTDGTQVKAGDTVTLSGPNGNLNHIVTNGEVAAGTFFFNNVVMNQGPNTFTATIKDTAGNVGPASAPLTVTYDTVAPTLAISDDVAGTATVADGAVTYTFTFSEDVGNSFTIGDVTVTGGAVGALNKVDATTYTLDVTPVTNTQGSIEVSVGNNKFQDIAGNGNAGTTTAASQPYDTHLPTVVVTDNVAGAANASTGLIHYTVKFDESVTGFDSSDVQVIGDAGPILNFTGSGDTYEFDLAPTADKAGGSIQVSVPAGGATDAAGNPNENSAINTQAVETTTFDIGKSNQSLDASTATSYSVLFTGTPPLVSNTGDSIVGFNAGGAGTDDHLNFKGITGAPLGSLEEGNGAFTGALNPYDFEVGFGSDTGTANLSGKIAIVQTGATAHDSATEIQDMFVDTGAGDDQLFTLTDSLTGDGTGGGYILAGDGGNGNVAHLWYVYDSNAAVGVTATAVLISTITPVGTDDINSFNAANFTFA